MFWKTYRLDGYEILPNSLEFGREPYDDRFWCPKCATEDPPDIVECEICNNLFCKRCIDIHFEECLEREVEDAEMRLLQENVSRFRERRLPSQE